MIMVYLIMLQAYGANVYSASQQPRADGKQMHSDAVQTEQPGRMMSGAAQTTTQVQVSYGS